MDQKGVQNPSRTISKDKKEPSGNPVRPGTYKIQIHHGDHSDETEITVRQDPRIEVNSTALQLIYDAQENLKEYKQLAADAVQQLAESKKTTKELQKKLIALDKENYAEIIKASNGLNKTIDSLISLYLGKDDKRQGIIRNKEMTVMKRIQDAERYISTRRNSFNTTEKQLMDFAKKDLDNAIDKTNEFFSGKWSEYRKSVEDLELSPFKEVKSLELD